MKPVTDPPERDTASRIVPVKEITMPTIANPRKRCVKNKAPKIIVHSGESVLRIPANELLSRVCAQANKKAGKKIPINPETNNLK